MKQSKFPINPIFKVLAKVVFFFYTWIFRAKAHIPPEVEKLKGGYLLLSNHVGKWDPFLIGYFLSHKPHFVASDALLRNFGTRIFMRGFGVIPKKKNIRDTQVIRHMMELAKNNGSIAIFPEASRTWTGRTLFIDDSVGKLIKMLKIPVVAAKMKGMFLSNPRWAKSIRKARIDIDYQLIASASEIEKLSADQLTQLVRNALQHNEMDYQKTNKIRIESNRRAEYMNHVLFYCPECRSLHGFDAKGNTLNCLHCGYEIFVNEYGFLESKGKAAQFSDIHDAFEFQNNEFTRFIQKQIDEKNSEILFSDSNILIHSTNAENKFELLGKAQLNFDTEKITADFGNSRTELFYIDDIQTLNPQLNERIEMFYQNKAYRFEGEKAGVSGLKWEIACNTVWRSRQQEFKLSTYFKA